MSDNLVFQAHCQWPMGSKAKSRCCLGMLKVSKLRHSYLDVMKLENYGSQGPIITKPHKSCIFLFFYKKKTFKIHKLQKWQTSFWNPHKKLTQLIVTFFLPNKNVDKF
jgi:hypothetical protein